MENSANLLKSIDNKTGSDWKHVGAVLMELEDISRADEKGRAWADRVLEQLIVQKTPMSKNHLHKIRRSYGFLEEGMKLLDLPTERASIARISSIEVAERLFQLDKKEGLNALDACLDRISPATCADINLRYNVFLAANPEMKKPRRDPSPRTKGDANLIGNMTAERFKEVMAEIGGDRDPPRKYPDVTLSDEDYVYVCQASGTIFPKSYVEEGRVLALSITEGSHDLKPVLEVIDDILHIRVETISRAEIHMALDIADQDFEDLSTYVLKTFGEVIEDLEIQSIPEPA
jgi:hypothetical protein